MNTARSIVFFLWLYGTMAVYTIVGLPALIFSRAGSREVMRAYCRAVLFGLRYILNIRVEVRGRKHIPDGPLIIAGKHQAMLDIFIPLLIVHDPIVVMKRELLWYPGLGWYALRGEMIAIKRDGAAKTVKHMIGLAKKRVKAGAGRQLVIYPEGTRSLPSAKATYQSGGLRAFYKALDLPILPIATNSGLCWKARGITRRPGHVVYEALPLVSSSLNHNDMLEQVETALETASDRLLDEGLAAQNRTRADLP
ncbi:MAG: lysophospholipid acyltransferase family protein [Pseudomonadota bacterium]